MNFKHRTYPNPNPSSTATSQQNMKSSLWSLLGQSLSIKQHQTTSDITHVKEHQKLVYMDIGHFRVCIDNLSHRHFGSWHTGSGHSGVWHTGPNPTQNIELRWRWQCFRTHPFTQSPTANLENIPPWKSWTNWTYSFFPLHPCLGQLRWQNMEPHSQSVCA